MLLTINGVVFDALGRASGGVDPVSYFHAWISWPTLAALICVRGE